MTHGCSVVLLQQLGLGTGCLPCMHGENNREESVIFSGMQWLDTCVETWAALLVQWVQLYVL
jgi:hypothetical protein